MVESATADRPAAVEAGVCPHCEGRGWVVERDGGAGRARPCACRNRDLAARLVAASGLPPTYSGCRLSGFKVTHGGRPGARDQLARARAESLHYVEDFLTADGSFCDTGLIYVGRTGAGKTHLAAAVLVEIIERYKVRGRFVEFTPLIYQIQSTFDPESAESKHTILDPIIEAPLLVLDELGAQKATPWVQDVLYLIINTRYTRRLPTLFTTNYGLDPPRFAEESLDRGPDPIQALEPLSRRLPETLVSRLCEMARPVVLDAVDDYRRQVVMPRRRR